MYGIGSLPWVGWTLGTLLGSLAGELLPCLLYTSHYLYEFSCGPLSGWMYRVDGEFPNYGCSKYELSDGQNIEWVYTCNLGKDVGCEWTEEDMQK